MEAKILALAQSTETNSLCKAWGLGRSAVLARKKGEHPMTVMEALALSRINGLSLVQVLQPLSGPLDDHDRIDA